MNQDSQAQSTPVEQVNALLPQTQCRQCGFDGCRPYAEAIIKGESINKCPPGGNVTINKLAKLLRTPAIELDPAQGSYSPPSVVVIREPECIGCTKCIQACPVDAILGAGKLMHTVIADECTGCNLCIEPCPVDCIDIVTVDLPELPSKLPAGLCETPDGLPIETELQGQTFRLGHRQHWRQRYEFRQARITRNEVNKKGSRRRSLARPDIIDKADAALKNFSRERARKEIAEAVARVKARKTKSSQVITTDTTCSDTDRDE